MSKQEWFIGQNVFAGGHIAHEQVVRFGLYGFESEKDLDRVYDVMLKDGDIFEDNSRHWRSRDFSLGALVFADYSAWVAYDGWMPYDQPDRMVAFVAVPMFEVTDTERHCEQIDHDMVFDFLDAWCGHLKREGYDLRQGLLTPEQAQVAMRDQMASLC